MNSIAEDNRLTNEWRQNLKEGDEVAVSSRHSVGVYKVTRTTPTQIHVGNSKFSRSRGDLIGEGKWDSTSLERPTDELKATIHARRIRQVALRKFSELVRNPNNFTTEELQTVIAILEPKKIEECSL